MLGSIASSRAPILPRSTSTFARLLICAVCSVLLAIPGSAGAQETAPRVREISVSGTNWSKPFLKNLKKTKKGRDGFRLRGKSLLTPIPWGIDTIRVRFTRDVSVDRGALTLTNTKLKSLAIESFSYDPESFTAEWKLEREVRSAGLLLTLSDSVSAVSGGQKLDGEFTGKFASGDSTAGGELVVPFAVLKGDADADGRVGSQDGLLIIDRISTVPVEAGEAAYNARLDINADGRITQSDLRYIQRNAGAGIAGRRSSDDPSGIDGNFPGQNGRRGSDPSGPDGDPGASGPNGSRQGNGQRPGDGRRSSVPVEQPLEKYAPGRLIVKLADSTRAAALRERSRDSLSFEELNNLYGVRRVKPIGGNAQISAESVARAARSSSAASRDRMANTYVLRLERGADVEKIAEAYAGSPDVEYAEPDYYVRVNLTPNDPSYSQLYAMPKIQAPAAWDITQGDDVVVAVIDTGVSYNHPDLSGNIWSNTDEIANNGIDDDQNGYIDDIRGWDFVNNDRDPMDDQSHGSHCAGTVAAMGNNGVGVIGVAFRAKIMPLKVLGADGSGTLSAIAAAIRYAAQNGAQVTSNSYGAQGYSQTLADAFAFAKSRNVVNIVAAGNSSADASGFTPAGLPFPDVVTVGASDQSDRRASFSNFGATVEVAAPGVSILSTVLNGGYASYSGTSMATPHVAGLAALYLRNNPGATQAAVSQRLIDTGVTLQAGTNIGKRINALAMVQPPAPSITSFSPASGQAGAQVSISGANFTGATQVTFNGTSAVFTVSSASSISATVPGSATTGPIRVTTTGGTAVSSSNFTVIVPPPPPSVSGFSPAQGPAGAVVTITGANLDGASSVKVNGVACPSFTVGSATSITAMIPAGSATGRISVTTPGGSANSAADFVVIQPPSISGLSPAQGAVNTDVTISGANLSGASSVTFNGLPAQTFSVLSASSISARVPAGATSGLVRITTPGGSANSPGNFTVIPAPTIGSFSPAQGAADTLVTVNGANFSGATAVSFNGMPASSFLVASATQLTARVPVGATTGRIRVSTPGGTAESASDFIAIPAPVISAFSPSQGQVGASVTISGSGFSGASALRFNGTSASFSVSSDTQIVAVVPSGATSGPLALTAPGGSVTSAGSFTVLSVPALSGFSPAQGPVGTLVTITGTALSGTSAVAFNGVAATNVTVVSSTTVTARVPAGAATGRIVVSVPGSQLTSGSDFTVTVPPTLASFSPARGTENTLITILGSGFADGSTSVNFNGTNATVVAVESPTRLQARVPRGAISGPITITTSAGTAQSSSSYTVLSPPRIQSFSPPAAPVGTLVTFIGGDFTRVHSVGFNGTSTSDFTVISATELVVRVPAGATTGRVAVAIPEGTSRSLASFTVTTEELAPSVSAVEPASGDLGGWVNVRGTGLSAVSAVEFGGVPAEFEVVSDSSVWAIVPDGAVSAAVTVRTAGGEAASPSQFEVIASELPVITGMLPLQGRVGDTLTLLGDNFESIYSARFGSVEAEFALAAGNLIEVTIPAGAASGALTIEGSAGRAVSPQSFTIVVPD